MTTRYLLLLLSILLVPFTATAGSQIDNVSALRAAADFATRAGKEVWRVLFYVDITKSIGLRGRSLCIYVDAASGKPIGALDDCAI
jgi:hypothetical protein